MKIENVLYLMTNLFAFQRLIHTTINHTVSSFQMHNFFCSICFYPWKTQALIQFIFMSKKKRIALNTPTTHFFPSLDCKLSFASLSSSLPQCETLADCVCTNLMANKQKNMNWNKQCRENATRNLWAIVIIRNVR